ncbi:MAG: hypothetical protein KA152_06890 [Verrucomicrobiales bacterium]|nr:hypothetical protein [Verrucomicrobiales bacterium]
MPSYKLTRRLHSLEARIDSVMFEGRQNHEFGIVGAGLAAAQHVGANLIVKNAMKPGSKANRGMAALFRKGVNDRRAGKRIKGGLVGASEALLGPEFSKAYEAGVHSSRSMRYAASRLPAQDDTQEAFKRIITTRGSKRVTKAVNKLPTTKDVGGYGKGKNIGRAVGAGAIMAADPVGSIIPIGMNLSKTALANSAERGGVGRKIVDKIFKYGAKRGKSSGTVRSVVDTVVSPSANIIRDAGASSVATAEGLRKKGLTKSMIGKMSKKDMKESGRAMIESGRYQPRK